MKRAFALVGLRASGKSTVGRALAELLHVPFVDLDEELVRASKFPSIGELFITLGEPAFREIETRVLEDTLANDESIVIATGGGVVERERNRVLLAEHAFVVWLDVPVPELQRRLRADPVERPSLTGPDAVSEVPEIARRREPLYAALAALRVAADSGTPTEIAAGISFRLAGQGLTP